MTPFQQDIKNQIAKKLKQLRKEGTVSIGKDNLYQLLRLNGSLDGAPKGTNAAFYAKQIYNEIVGNAQMIAC